MMNPLKERTAYPIPAGAGVSLKRRTAGAISRARTIWVAGLLTVVSGATAPAATLNFNIDNNGGLFDERILTPVSVTGTFTFDSVKLAISNFNVTFTGESAAAGTYTDTSTPYLDLSNSDRPRIHFNGSADDGTLMNLGLDLSGIGTTFSSYEIVGGFWFIPAFRDPALLVPHDDQNRPAVVRVVSEPAVPEPSTWAMVLGAFASAGTVMRIRRRKESTK